MERFRVLDQISSLGYDALDTLFLRDKRADKLHEKQRNVRSFERSFETGQFGGCAEQT